MRQCLNNVKKFRGERAALTAEEQIAFIREQYGVLSVLGKVAAGSVQLHGVSYFKDKGQS